MSTATGSALAASVFVAFTFVSCDRVEERDTSARNATKPADADGRATTQANASVASAADRSGILHSLPSDVQRALYDETGKISDRVDPLMRQKDDALAIVDPAKRRDRIDTLRDAIGALASELEELLDDPAKPWAKYRHDPSYSHCFQQYENRFRFYASELSDLKRRSEIALEEAKARLR